MSRLSGLQRDVLSLYRRILRESMKKDRQEQLHRNNNVTSSSMTNDAFTLSVKQKQQSLLALYANGGESFVTNIEAKATTTAFAIAEFRRQAASVQRSDFKKIEYMIRKGEKQIKLLRMPRVTLVTGIHTSKLSSQPSDKTYKSII
jgi:hypothetical protein